MDSTIENSTSEEDDSTIFTTSSSSYSSNHQDIHTHTPTTTDTDTNSDSSLSSSFTTTNSSTINSSVLLIPTKKKIQKKKYFTICLTIILFNILLFSLNILIFFFSIQYYLKKNHQLSSHNDDLKKGVMYEMIYYNHAKETYINEIVEYDEDINFEGDFYHIEDGVIVKLDVEGDVYRLCAEKCECVVECEKKDDCRDGKECIEYVCVDNESVKKRKETNNEKVVAQVVVIVPIALCVFGVFSSMYLAKEYSHNYFSDVCDKSCPRETVEVINSETDEVIEVERDGAYFCGGICDSKYLGYDLLVEYMRNGVWNPPNVVGTSINNIQQFFNENAKIATEKCKKSHFERIIASPNKEGAMIAFFDYMETMCKFVTHDFTFNGKKIVDEDFEDEIICVAQWEDIECELPKNSKLDITGRNKKRG